MDLELEGKNSVSPHILSLFNLIYLLFFYDIIITFVVSRLKLIR